MKKVTRILLVFSFIGLVLPACTELDLQQAMAEMDEVYIPVWLSLKDGDSENAQFYLNRLNTEWEIVQSSLNDDLPNFTDEVVINKTDRLLTEASWALKEGNPQEAYVAISRIRYKLIQLRAQHHVDYYLDKVWAFQIAQADFHEVADDDVLCWLGWNKVEEMEKELRYLWRPIKKEGLPPAFYLTENKITNFNKHHEAIDNKMELLHTAVKCADREHMALISAEVGHHLDSLIRVFGNFEVETTALIID